MTPEGRMDPQMSDTPLDTARAKLEAIHKMADAGSVWGEAHTRVEIRRLARTALALLDEHAAASARREGETHDFKCYRCDKPLIANQTMEMCPACYEAVDLEPPKPPSADAVKDMRVEQNAFVDREIENSMRPRPSADARAKLERALKAILAEPYGCPFCDSGKLRNPTNDHTETCGFKLAADALLALPPHEGETPQVRVCPFGAGTPTGWWSCSCGAEHQGETPQPAAERGWREMNTTLCRLANLLKHGRRDQGRIERIIEEIRNLAAIAATHASLPPVVQTRPEEPEQSLT